MRFGAWRGLTRLLLWRLFLSSFGKPEKLGEANHVGVAEVRCRPVVKSGFASWLP
jgi:hypothetical protein